MPEVGKHIDEWCRHCRPGKGGCSIYEQRPQTCKEFTCGWLVGAFGDEWFRPITIRVSRRFVKLMPDGTERESVYSREHIEGVRADQKDDDAREANQGP